ncbi:hypothetical protein [Halalkalibacterium ligniniphilum]|uniref:hypothetical protein n=1 Tax=Halalkalibacterium ligniniphilum TaxID=1134413 RepID=UPI000376AFAD|nr:hypothetical protein [Halalkalibacterium ligniniphilum]
MKKTFLLILLVFVMQLTFQQPSSASTPIAFYLDGQEQRYGGQVIRHEGMIWLPVRPILEKLADFHATWNGDYLGVNRLLRGEDVAEEEVELFAELDIRSIQNRDMISIEDVRWLGFDAYLYESENILHVSTPDLMTVADISIGLSMDEVNRKLGDIHWNTGFGQEADYIGFYGEMKEFTYVDRYGYKRKGSVPDIQIEIKEDAVSYILVSSENFPTSKGVKVGDRISEVTRAYGSQAVREQIDGKQVVIYDVEYGSIWFIANQQNEIERIGYWNHHIKGFGKEEEEAA